MLRRWSVGVALAVLVGMLPACASGSSGSVRAGAPARGTVRRSFIAADEVQWNYAPDGHNVITGQPFDAVADTYVKAAPDRIGSVYTKCLYRAYTDATFTRRVPRPARDAYMGILGPAIHAAVGDTILVTFRNNCSFPASMHPHGVFYTKSSEGAPYHDGTSGADKADDAVPTGGTHLYRWLVPERAGPASMDGSSVLWMYHSHTDEIHDTYSGLVGPIVVTARGMARADGTPKDVDQEVFSLFSVMNENQSHYIAKETAALPDPPKDPDDDEEFNESNLMHSINGYVFGNGTHVKLKLGTHVRWYVMSLGTEVDLHTPHWHGNTVIANGMRTDMVSLLPASMVVADMTPDDPGTWLYHCHVNDHIAAGMQTLYEVVP
jgi:FtsP/CotA-like multicopper oxidase with cupredoxin domain